MMLSRAHGSFGESVEMRCIGRYKFKFNALLSHVTFKVGLNQKLSQLVGSTDEICPIPATDSDKKREELKLENNRKSEVDHDFDISSYQKQTFLDLLVRLSGGEHGYSDEELREEILTLLVAGTDTSAVGLGYTLKLLAMYPKVQDKVFEELQEVFGDSDRPLVKEDLLKLKYLERVLKESLRLFPPVPFIIRKVLEDVTLRDTTNGNPQRKNRARDSFVRLGRDNEDIIETEEVLDERRKRSVEYDDRHT
ncbi:cytochrome P450 4C1-like [Papilio machaon]|uniref:cytochrome P450 4C1-like n=1 Tax=Papilio machaon TaxID=76193 RepID=UPI001E6643F5|nr:cytochrome P450 4C1-like [Papilio machaon]